LAAGSADSPAPTRRYYAPAIAIGLWIVAAIVSATADFGDEAISFLVFASASAAATIAIVVWCAFFANLPRRFALAPLVVALLAVAALFSIYSVDYSGGMRFKLRNRWGPSDADLALDADIKATADSDLLAPVAGPTDFPQFLGTNRDDTVTSVTLARDWDARPPKLVWRQPIGAGWSAFSAVGPWAVTQEQRGDSELVACYEIGTGKLRWTHTNPGRFHPNFGLGGDGPRATPSIDGATVYAMTSFGVLDAIDFVTGQLRWSIDVIADSGSKVEYWGKSASPLVVDDKVIVSAGGPNGNSLIAYDKRTGKRIWAGGDDPSSYASPTLMTLGGVRQVVCVNQDWVVGHDLATGQLLWKHYFKGSSSSNASNTQPHAAGGDRVFVSKGYTIGAELFQVSRGDARAAKASGTPSEAGTGEAPLPWSTATIWPDADSGRRVMKSKLSNVAIRAGFVYGLDDGTLQCVDLETGKSRWKRGRFEHGQQLLVGDLLLVMSENTGELNLVEATPQEFRLLGKAQVLDPTKTWNNLCLVGNRLLVRNDQQAACFELPLAEKQVEK
jgi:outer membrane protein assembly factor BamB